ncbi:serine/threonine-protein kinase [Catenuloplanes indicus]|uniref:Serine/threonine-protein kinase n=1 Tax=Catenuloplanes indicus TaxID=137267 RepID=A0AAE3VZE8_9ACTN|nr:serine/threonine-protein kinase [Catenuloplanes indicus]MDQ0366127.1 serine/threonine-protein kinase [Catenuloplanes indicus]
MASPQPGAGLNLPMGVALARRYVLIGPVARGGLSTVYHAIDAVHGRPAAVKVLSSDDPWVRESARREARITDRLRHPGVPRVYDYGDAGLADGRTVPYVAMELLTGVSLAGRVAGGPLPWREAVRIAATVTDVLAAAHRRGVVHRDLNPSNVMLTARGIKIVDFGLAALIEPEGERRTRLGPPPSPADDVYAAGVLLYALLTGRSPYPAARPGALLAGPMHGLAPTPVLLVDGLPATVAEACRWGMRKRPVDRPTAAELAVALWRTVLPHHRLDGGPVAGRGGRPGPGTRAGPVAPRTAAAHENGHGTAHGSGHATGRVAAGHG